MGTQAVRLATTTPTAKGLPVVGLLPQVLRDPPAAFMRIARQHPGAIVRAPIVGPFDLYVVTRPEHMQHILQDNWRNYPKGEALWDALRALLGNGLITSSGEDWVKNRRVLQPLFGAKRIASLAGLMVSIIDRSLSALGGHQTPVDLVEEMSVITQNVVLETVFGTAIPRAEASRLAKALGVAMREINLRMMLFFLPKGVPLPGDKKLATALAELDEGLLRLSAEHEAKGKADGEDMLSLLRNARDPETGEGMSARQLRDEIVTMWTAGNETTSTALAWFWMLLDKHPEVLAAVQAEVDEVLGDRTPTGEDVPRLSYTKKALLEAMRLYSPSWIIPRKCEKDDVVDGYRIPGGSNILIVQYATHRDPDLWEDPERFDPERFSPERIEKRHRFAHLPFSGGPRVCIGMGFAMMEAQLIVAMTLQRFKLRFSPEQTLRYEPAATLRPRGQVQVRFLKKAGKSA